MICKQLYILYKIWGYDEEVGLIKTNNWDSTFDFASGGRTRATLNVNFLRMFGIQIFTWEHKLNIRLTR
jgi:hypothetical protein